MFPDPAQSLVIDRELESRYREAHAPDQTGDLHALPGQPDEALSRWQEAAAMFDQIHHPEGAAVHTKISS